MPERLVNSSLSGFFYIYNLSLNSPRKPSVKYLTSRTPINKMKLIPTNDKTTKKIPEKD